MIRLFHVSDVHFGREDKVAVAWFDGLVKAEQPDAVVMTGDLTMRARASEFEAGLGWLSALGVPVTVEVGNHDLPYFNLLARFFRPYARIRAVEEAVERPLALPGVVIVPMRTTARFQWRLNWAKGRVSRRSLRDALALIDAAPADALVFVACHHPLTDPHTAASAQTHGGAAALSALAEAGVDAVLTGHVHDPFDVEYEPGAGRRAARRIAGTKAGQRLRMIGAGTLSERTRDTPPSFNEIIIEGGRFDVRVRAMEGPSAVTAR